MPGTGWYRKRTTCDWVHAHRRHRHQHPSCTTHQTMKAILHHKDLGTHQQRCARNVERETRLSPNTRQQALPFSLCLDHIPQLSHREDC